MSLASYCLGCRGSGRILAGLPSKDGEVCPRCAGFGSIDARLKYETDEAAFRVELVQALARNHVGDPQGFDVAANNLFALIRCRK